MNSEPTNALDRLQAGILAEVERFKRAHHTNTLAASDNPNEKNPIACLRPIADEWAARRTDDEQRTAFLDNLAQTLTLEDIRDIRRTAEAAAKLTPRLIREAAGRGTPAPSIAATLGIKESYVYRVLRDTK